MLTPGLRKEFIDCRKSEVGIVVLLIMYLKTCRNFTMELLECAYRLREFTCLCLQNPVYREYQPLFTRWDEWIIVKYITEHLGWLQWLTLWMSKWHMITFHHVITVYNAMLDHIAGVMIAVGRKKTPCQNDLFFAVMLAQQKMSKYYAEVTPTTCILLISTHVLHPFPKLR